MSESEIITWSDEMGHRSRRAWCLLVKGDQVAVFDGASMPGWVAVLGTDYHKNGKWSHTTYRMTLAPGVRIIRGRDGWEQGTFAEGLQQSDDRLGRAAWGRENDAVSRDGGPRIPRIDRWGDLAGALGVTVPAAMRFLRAWRPKAAEKFDEIEAQLEAVDEAAGPDGVQEIAVSFGSPTRRMRSDGFWSWPVLIRDASGTIVVSLHPDDYASTDTRVRVLACERTSGHGGGYMSLRLAIPVGWSAVHERPSEPDPGGFPAWRL